MSADETIVRMPRLADTLVEGTLAQWLKQVGESVGEGEPLASIETDKVTTELTSPAAGTMLETLVAAGTTVPVDTPLARIGSPALAPEAATAARETTPVDAPSWEKTPSAEPPRKTTPVAARLLVEHGLTPDQVPSQSVRLKRDDVLAYVAAHSTEPRQVTPLSSMRRAIAEHMTRAYQTIPQGQTVMAADLTALVAWRDTQKAHGTNLTFTVCFVYALARPLAGLAGEPVDVGVAVALDQGLIVPVVRKASELSLIETADALADLAARARSNRLKPDEMQGARMTVTNVGSFGNLTASPIVPLGQMGILGPGLVERRPMPAADGGIRLGWRCLLSFVYDRRALSEFDADRFLRSVVDELTRIPST